MACGCSSNCNCSSVITLPTSAPGAPGANGMFGGWSQRMVFDAATSASPLARDLRLNNATPANVTEIYVNDLNADGNDIDPFLDAFSNNNSFGLVKLWKQYDSSIFWMGKVTGVTDNGADHTVSVTHVASNGTFADNDSIVISYVANGASGNTFFSGTYASIAALVSSGTLVTGANYLLTDYQTVHAVAGLGSLLNINTTGYVTKIEPLLLQASSSTTFFHEVESTLYPQDDIHYDFTANTVAGTARNGFIYRRRNNTNNVSAHFDVRNQIIARYSLNTGSIAFTANPVDRQEIVYDGSRLLISFRDGSLNTNYRLVEDASFIDIGPQTVQSVSLFGNTIPTITPTYHEAIGFVGVSDIELGKGVLDVLIENSQDVVIGAGTQYISVLNSANVKVGSNGSTINLYNTDRCNIGAGCSQVYVTNSNDIVMGNNNAGIALYQASTTNIGSSHANLFIHASLETTVGSGGSSIMLNRASNQNTFADNCAGISLGNSDTNSFAQSCTDIEIYSGGHNRFAQGCSTINLIGELDNAYIGATNWGQAANYYSPYSQMEHNTFGTGCKNITFNILGGRGNQFGDECKNLAFTKADYSENWRLVGCHFARGIQNKTFEHIVHGCSFLVPNQVTATITKTNWYAPAMYVNTNRTDSWSYVIELPDSGVANSYAYTLSIEVKTPGAASVTSAVTYTSDASATKAEIITGIAAAINAVTGVNARIIGDRMYVDSVGTFGLNPSNKPMALSNTGATAANHFIFIPTNERTTYDHRMYMQAHNFDDGNHIAIGFAGEGGGNFGPPSGTSNMAQTVLGALPTADQLRLKVDSSGGCIVQGRAFMFTRLGYPLAIMFDMANIASHTNPTATLEYP